MSRPVTLFTGQWADLPLADLAPLAKKMGYDGLELACWGDHFDVAEALRDPAYIPAKWALLQKHGLACYALSAHLVGQCVCDNIDARHQQILPAHVWGDGNPEAVRQRAAEELKRTAQASRKFFDAAPAPIHERLLQWGDGDKHLVIPAFTGSSIWHLVYSFPPVLTGQLDAGYTDFAARFTPILDAFANEGLKFALEVHPTEIAFDIVSAHRALAALNHHPAFGFNFDPSHLVYQGVDYLQFLREFGIQQKRIFHVHMKDAYLSPTPRRSGVFGGHLPFGDPERLWEFRSLGHGSVRFEEVIRHLNFARYAGPLSIEWEDQNMDRIHGATEAAAFTRKLDFAPSEIPFDAQFDR